MKEPTYKQLTEFWEWVSPGLYGQEGFHARPLPELDLNNLFKYAVPKLIKCGYNMSIYYLIGKHKEDSTEGKWTASVSCDAFNQASYQSNEDPVLSLFWAIWGMIK